MIMCYATSNFTKLRLETLVYGVGHLTMTYCGYSSLLHITNNINNTTEPPTQPAQWDGCTSTSPDCRMWEPVWSEVNTNN